MINTFDKCLSIVSLVIGCSDSCPRVPPKEFLCDQSEDRESPIQDIKNVGREELEGVECLFNYPGIRRVVRGACSHSWSINRQ